MPSYMIEEEFEGDKLNPYENPVLLDNYITANKLKNKRLDDAATLFERIGEPTMKAVDTFTEIPAAVYDTFTDPETYAEMMAPWQYKSYRDGVKGFDPDAFVMDVAEFTPFAAPIVGMDVYDSSKREGNSDKKSLRNGATMTGIIAATQMIPGAGKAARLFGRVGDKLSKRLATKTASRILNGGAIGIGNVGPIVGIDYTPDEDEE